MLLYNAQISGNCYKVRLLLAHLGIPYEVQAMDVADRSDRPDVLGSLNPALRVPTLVLDDGRPLAESNAIMVYFTEGTEYLPADRYERALVLQWLFFEQYQHEPYVAVARFLMLFKADTTPPEEFTRVQTQGSAAIAIVDRHLQTRDFLVADRYSIADIALYAYTHVAPEGGISLDPFPSVRAWMSRVEQQPGHVPLLG